MKQTNHAAKVSHRKSKPSRKLLKLLLITAAAVLLVSVGYWYLFSGKSTKVESISTTSTSPKTTPNSKSTPPVAVTPPNHCADNTLNQNIIVSISERHLWACSQTTLAYDSSVITGMENLPADLTPTGTYHIYAKETNQYLNGSDSTGSWHDYVYYWMPFLDNQYGVYGFHDATWRAPTDFGNISPDSSNASHGCVETPLATAKWLFNWSSIGTTVTITS